MQYLINEEFGVEYHPVYLSEFLKDLGLSYAIPRTKRPSRPDNAEEVLDERADELRDELEALGVEVQDTDDGPVARIE